MIRENGAEAPGFRCPVCGEPLAERDNAFACGKGHSFDRARQGYVNLLPANKMHSRTPGDTGEMVESRRRFLDGGYYEPFRRELVRLAREVLADREAPVIVDAGCGEGYYTQGLFQAFPECQVIGLDISKAAVKAAAGRYKGIRFAVASSFALPLADGACDLLTDVFSPLAAEEFARVVRPGGTFLYAVPGERHLYGLKEILYREPYENERKDTEYPGFVFEGRREVRETVEIPDGKTAMDLFAMTPYYWKTGVDGSRRLREITGLSTEIAFDFLVYRRKDG